MILIDCEFAFKSKFQIMHTFISSLLTSIWVQEITSARQHYACHGCSMQAAEQLEVAEKLLAVEQR